MVNSYQLDLHEYLWSYSGSYGIWGNYITDGRKGVSHSIFYILMYKMAIVIKI